MADGDGSAAELVRASLATTLGGRKRHEPEQEVYPHAGMVSADSSQDGGSRHEPTSGQDS